MKRSDRLMMDYKMTQWNIATHTLFESGVVE